MTGSLAKTLLRRRVAVIGSVAALVVSLVCCLIYGWATLRYYHQHDPRLPHGLWAYFNSNIDLKYEASSVSHPCLTGWALTSAAIVWLSFMIFRRQWPRS
jgi:hypothetical protein